MFVTVEDFKKIDFRVGTIVQAQLFKEAKKPAYEIMVDLGGDIGLKKSSAQLTKLYKPEDLIGKQVLCVVNFKPMQIGPMKSEILITGFECGDGKVVLSTTDQKTPNGIKLS